MKACLMKVNYNPKYTTPHSHGPSNPTYEPLQSRLNVTREIYGGEKNRLLREQLEEAAKRKFRSSDVGRHYKSDINREKKGESKSASQLQDKPSKHEKTRRHISVDNDRDSSITSNDGDESDVTMEKHKEGVAKAHATLKLQPINAKNGLMGGNGEKQKNKSAGQGKLAYKPHSHSNFPNLVSTSSSPKKSTQFSQPKINHSVMSPKFAGNPRSNGLIDAKAVPYQSMRSRTSVGHSSEPYVVHKSVIKSADILEIERKARVEVERAVRDKKVFSITGPYHSLRQALRRRGWVEKFQNMTSDSTSPRRNKEGDLGKPPASAQPGDDDDDDLGYKKDPKIKPWLENNGIYGIMSHMLRNAVPSFVFTVKSNDVDSRVVKNSQLVNHFGKARVFTTKAGLCLNLRNVPWYDRTDPYTFYPRSYKLDEEDEKEAFRDDFLMTSCIGMLKHYVHKYKNYKNPEAQNAETHQPSPPSKPKRDYQKSAVSSKSSKSSKSRADSPYSLKSHGGVASETGGSTSRTEDPSSDKSSQVSTALNTSYQASEVPSTEGQGSEVPEDKFITPRNCETPRVEVSKTETGSVVTVQSLPPLTPAPKKKPGNNVTIRALEVAMEQCERYIQWKNHDDIDTNYNSTELRNDEKDQFLSWYYQFVHDNGEMNPVSVSMVAECEEILNKLEPLNPQHVLEGSQNVWIIKPGAKSRGRGIQLYNKLQNIFNCLDNGDSHMVIQKYIERPLLVHGAKFDIRQWFLVTDWSPLTLWFYQDCYLRFCGQRYTLDDFHESIHLSNNSVQKHYERSCWTDKLPDDNMWTSDEFDQYIQDRGDGNKWTELCVPGMKRAILCSMLCTQEHVEARKSAFELYGADFMLSEDLQPWLIEINSSPSMARNTRATAKLVENVCEDVLKVVLDRKDNKNCDTGRFELVYKQPTVQEINNYDPSLAIAGKKLKTNKKSKK